MTENTVILQPGNQAGGECPDCGGPLTLVTGPCTCGLPAGYGCGVAHWDSACLPCRQRHWVAYERPATIGEVRELNAKINRLIDALGLDEATKMFVRADP